MDYTGIKYWHYSRFEKYSIFAHIIAHCETVGPTEQCLEYQEECGAVQGVIKDLR